MPSDRLTRARELAPFLLSQEGTVPASDAHEAAILLADLAEGIGRYEALFAKVATRAELDHPHLARAIREWRDGR